MELFKYSSFSDYLFLLICSAPSPGGIDPAFVALVAFSGHLYIVYLKFKYGGKGVATAGGCFDVISPVTGMVVILVFYIVCLLVQSRIGCTACCHRQSACCHLEGYRFWCHDRMCTYNGNIHLFSPHRQYQKTYSRYRNYNMRIWLKQRPDKRNNTCQNEVGFNQKFQPEAGKQVATLMGQKNYKYDDRTDCKSKTKVWNKIQGIR